MSNPLQLLIVEDSESDAAMLVRALSKAGYDVQVERVEAADQMQAALARQPWDVVISDYSLPQFDAPAALVVLQQSGLDIPFIVVSGTVGEATAVAMMKAGAHDYLMKDNLIRLAPAVAREIREVQVRRERRRAEVELRKLFRAVEHSPASVVITDLRGSIEYVNPKFIETTGYTVTEAIGQNPRILKTDDLPDAEYKRLWETITAGGTWQGEFHNKKKDGELFWEIASISPVFDEQGEITHFVAVKEDITERKQAEEALKVSLERLSSIFRVAPIGIGMVINRIIKEVNQCMLEITGYSRAELIEQNARLLYTNDEEFERVGREKYAQLREQGIGVIETKWQRKDGSVRDILLSSTRINPDDEAAGVTFTALDITERKQAEELMRRSEQRYRTVADYTYDWEYWVGPDEQWLYCSPSCERITGYPAQYFLDDPAFLAQITHPDDRLLLTHHLAEIENPSQVENVDFRIIHRDGTIRWLNHVCRPIWGQDMQWLGRRSSNRDITERKQTENALRESETRYRLIADHVNDIVWQMDKDLRFVYTSPAVEHILGYSAEEVYQLPVTDLFNAESIAFMQRVIQSRLGGSREEVITPNAFKMRHKDGHLVDVEVVSSPIFDQSGQLWGFAGITRDITERKRAEETLRASEIRFSTIFHASPAAIAITRLADNQFIDVNKTWQTMTGYTYTEVIGHTPFDLNLWVKPEQRAALIKMLGEQGMARDEVQIRHKSGQIVYVLMSVDLIKLADEPYLLTMAQDITERKQLAAENEQLAAQFYQAQKLESIGRLAGGIAHDFNNLLVPIIGYTELGMLKLSPDSPLYADLKRIKDAGDRAANLTKQILAFSRQQMLEMKPVDLNQVISEFEPMLRRLIGEDINLQLHLAVNLPSLRGDKGQLEQILLNLAVNARDAMPDGGALTIETAQIVLDKAYVAKHPEAQPGPHALLVVSDTGQGMDAATLQRIFEPFFTTKGQGKGTGLGLATVFGIVKQHGGNIWVYSEPGQGTSFKIYLPLVAAPAAAVEAEQSASGPLNGQETVLLVEDEVSVRQLACDTLALYGYQVLAAAEPEKGLALAAAHQGPIHLLLSDVVMPQMRGPELAKRLITLHPEMKVLYMSGYTDQTITNHGIEPGQSFLQKPFNLNNLMQKVREVLDGTPA